jgi:hypothetical protein
MTAPTGTTLPTGSVARAVAGADAALGGLSNGVLRLEDAALVGWLLVGPPLARSLSAASPGGTALGGDHDPWSGLLYLVATVLAVAVLATRSPGDPVLGFEGISTARSYAPFPFLLSLGIVGQTGLDRLGIASDAVIGIVFLITMVCYVAWPHLPNLPRTTRRLMILPFILVAGTVFGGMVADLSSLFDYRVLLGDPSASPSAYVGLLGLQVLFSVFFYLAFIFAPRMVAEAEGSWLAWLARYALFLLVTIVSVTFLGAGGG